MRALFWGLFGWRRFYRRYVWYNSVPLVIDEWYYRDERIPRQNLNHLAYWLENNGFTQEGNHEDRRGR